MHFIVSGPAILLLAFFVDAQALLWQHANIQNMREKNEQPINALFMAIIAL